jgi:NADPH-dependent glutamate synthase beta subunit-like oxidoreductase
MPKPPEKENKLLNWPNWPLKLRTSSSHEEGAERQFSVLTERFEGENGRVKALHCIEVDAKMQKVPGSEFVLKADLVLLAMGFVAPVAEGLVSGSASPRRRGNARRPRDYKTSVDGSGPPATCGAAGIDKGDRRPRAARSSTSPDGQVRTPRLIAGRAGRPHRKT